MWESIALKTGACELLSRCGRISVDKKAGFDLKNN
jgi:hypothetical protein